MSGPPLVAAPELAAWVRHVDDRRALNTIWGLRSGTIVARSGGRRWLIGPPIIASFAGEWLGPGTRYTFTHCRCADGRHVHCARAQAGGRNRRQGRTLMGRRAVASQASFMPSSIPNGLPMRLALTTGNAFDSCLVLALLAGPEIGSDVACGSVDCGYHAERIRALDGPHCAAHGIHPTETNPESGPQHRSQSVELFFNKVEQRRRVAIATSN
jgi:hypothetical protein